MAHAPKEAYYSNKDDLKAQTQKLRIKLGAMPRSETPTLNPIRSDAQQVIDALRSDLGAQRQMLHELYDIVQPLVALSADRSSSLDEMRLSTLKSVFVTNAQFAEVSSDLRLEVRKLQGLAQAADKRRVVEVAGHNLHEVASAMLKEPSTPRGAAFGIDSLRQEFTGKVQELSKTTGIGSMGQEFFSKMQKFGTKVKAIDNALSSSRRDLLELSSAIDIALDSPLDREGKELREDLRGKVIEAESSRNSSSNLTGRPPLVGPARATNAARAIASSSTEVVDVAMLNGILDEIRAEFGHEIAALRDAVEHMALKAGYVAVAASVGSAEQNAALLEVLKAKEIELARTPHPRPPGVASMPSEKRPLLHPVEETTCHI